MYFIGVTTGASAIHRIFPKWCGAAGVEAELVGIDLPVGAPGPLYREAAKRIAEDPEAAGALVTTHKVAIAEHAGDLFASTTDEARRLGEISCIVKRSDDLHGDALDAESSGAALARIADPGGRDVLILGAGGAGTALALHLQRRGGVRVRATDVSTGRLQKIAAFGAEVNTASDNDKVVSAMPAGSIIVNATGLGKDLPGSPISEDARFPEDSIAWDLNYRGDLKFLEIAKRQGARTADGWDCFLLGWSLTVNRVLGLNVKPFED